MTGDGKSHETAPSKHVKTQLRRQVKNDSDDQELVLSDLAVLKDKEMMTDLEDLLVNFNPYTVQTDAKKLNDSSSFMLHTPVQPARCQACTELQISGNRAVYRLATRTPNCSMSSRYLMKW
jgi:rRNA maturation endonuclease Nob1